MLIETSLRGAAPGLRRGPAPLPHLCFPLGLLLLALRAADADDARGDVQAALVGADLPHVDFATLAVQLVGQVLVLLLKRELQRRRALADRRHIDRGYGRHLPLTAIF